MLNNGRRNIFVVALVIVFSLVVIIGAALLIFGDYLIPLIANTTPYSYVLLLVVALALFIYFT